MGACGVISSAAMMFASTNIDDALLLVVYFANAAEGKDGLKPRHVWAGQLLGFSIVMVISLIGTFVGSFLPPRFSGLLGFVPLIMGLMRMREWCKNEDADTTEDQEDEKSASKLEQVSFMSPRGKSQNVDVNAFEEPKTHEPQEPVTTAELRVRGSNFSKIPVPRSTRVQITAVAGKESGDYSHPDNLVAAQEKCFISTKFVSGMMRNEWVSSIFNVHSLLLMTVTLGNGGDNVAVYIPGLVTYTRDETLLSVTVFYVLLVTWIFAAETFVSFRFVANSIGQFGDYIIPIALVSLGIYILKSTDAMGLVVSFT